MKMNDILAYFALKNEGNFDKVFEAIANKEELEPDLYFNLKRNQKHKIITAIDKDYPEFLKENICPPIVLFYTGNKDLLNEDVPIKALILEDETRALVTISPTEQNGEIVLDYLIACENHDKVDLLLDHIKEKGIPLKHYEKTQNRGTKVC